MEKEIVVKCSNIVKTKRGEEVKCNRYLLTISEYKISFKCPKCGTDNVMTRDSNGQYRIIGFPKGNCLIGIEETEK